MSSLQSLAAPDWKQLKRSVTVREIFGLTPLGPSLKQCLRAILGDKNSPPTQWGLSSLQIFKPSMSVPLWLGQKRFGAKVPIYNFVNRKAPELGGAYSVKVTDCEDFRGQQWTYDGHVGTDFAVPAKTPICACRQGRVALVRNDMNRGGLKVVIDHGQGLFASYNHLSRALTKPGDHVKAGQVIGLSGMSGVDGVLFFPWLAPHLHLTIFHDCRAVDPFAQENEVSLWLNRNDPKPIDVGETASLENSEFEPSQFDHKQLLKTLEHCKNLEFRNHWQSKLQNCNDTELYDIGFEVFFAMNFFSAWFAIHPNLTVNSAPRTPVLNLPFRAQDYSGCWLPELPA